MLTESLGKRSPTKPTYGKKQRKRGTREHFLSYQMSCHISILCVLVCCYYQLIFMSCCFRTYCLSNFSALRLVLIVTLHILHPQFWLSPCSYSLSIYFFCNIRWSTALPFCSGYHIKDSGCKEPHLNLLSKYILHLKPSVANMRGAHTRCESISYQPS